MIVVTVVIVMIAAVIVMIAALIVIAALITTIAVVIVMIANVVAALLALLALLFATALHAVEVSAEAWRIRIQDVRHGTCNEATRPLKLGQENGALSGGHSVTHGW